MGVHLLLPWHGENPPTLEIFSYEEFVDHDPIMANFIGFTHIAFEVEGVGMLKFTYFRDPEGNIIEIQSWS